MQRNLNESWDSYVERRKAYNKVSKKPVTVLWHSLRCEAQEDGSLKIGKGVTYKRSIYGELG